MRFLADAAAVFRKETAPHNLNVSMCSSKIMPISSPPTKLHHLFPEAIHDQRGKNILQISFLVTPLSAYGPDPAWAILLEIVADKTDFGRRQSKPLRRIGPTGRWTIQNDALLMRIVTR